jgi:MoxR-like ATPase
MKPSELFEALHALISERVPLHIWGACGVGKSQIVAQVASDLDWQFLDIRAVQLDPVDLRGLPRISADQAEWVPPKFLPISGRGMQYLDRMPTEMRVLAIRDAAARNRGITHTPEFVRFGVEHAEVLQ